MSNLNNHFMVGDSVVYTPIHTRGDVNHPDSEPGVVTSMNGEYVYVNFGKGSTSQACHPRNLVHGEKADGLSKVKQELKEYKEHQ